MNSEFHISRRRALKAMGWTAVSIGFAGCGGGSSSSESVSSTAESSSSLAESSVSSTASSTVSSAATTRSWASGSTDLITVDYPDDSLFDDAGICDLSLTERTTEGPCYLGVDEKEDLSEGKTGLPMMLCLQLIDSECNPLEGYLIEVWHCDSEGIYSADTDASDDSSSFAGDFCTGGDVEAQSSTWFRGEAYTDSSGRVNFKTCFPGWYSGRTIHIHYRVRMENGGSDYIVSQFCFTDDFCEEICTTHDGYLSRGTQDTTLSSGTDTVFPSSDYAEFVMETEQNEDGSLLAYKRIMIGDEVLEDSGETFGYQDGFPGTPSMN